MVSSDNPRDLVRWIKAKTEAISEVGERAVSDNVSYGAEVTKDNVATRGTFKSGKRGRIETSDMIDSVSGRVLFTSPERVQGEFGFIDTKHYTKFQEYGFEHVGGTTVEGMYALTDAYEEVKQNLIEDLEEGLYDL